MKLSLSQAISNGDLNEALTAPTVSEANKAESKALTAMGLRGKADGEKIQLANAEYASKLAQTAVAILVKAAAETNEDTLKEYLTGYGEAFGKNAKFRKTEAKAIIDAYLLKPETVVAMAEKGDGYHDIVKACREIRGKRVNTNTPAPKVTDKQAEKINEAISIATLPQASAIAHNAALQIVATAKKDWENEILRQIDDLAGMLSKSEQPIFQVIAEDIANTCAEVLQTGTHAPEAVESEQQDEQTAPIAAQA